MKSLSDMFGPKVVEEFDSRYSGKIRVMQGFGYKYVSTGILTQSGGIVKDVWDPVLKKIGQKNCSWLILGLAAGTLAEQIAKRFTPSRLVGVEIDQIMIDIGKKYFSLDEIKSLEIVNQDANKFVASSSFPGFDFILVDMYLGEVLPDFVYSDIFLDRLKSHGKTVVFNHLFYDDGKKKLAANLMTKLESRFKVVTPQRVLTNVMLLCSQGI